MAAPHGRRRVDYLEDVVLQGLQPAAPFLWWFLNGPAAGLVIFQRFRLTLAAPRPNRTLQRYHRLVCRNEHGDLDLSMLAPKPVVTSQR